MTDDYEPLTVMTNARAWVRHWRRDRESNLLPTAESLLEAEVALTVAIEMLKKQVRG